GRAPFPEDMKTAYTDGKVKAKLVLQSQAGIPSRNAHRQWVTRMAPDRLSKFEKCHDVLWLPASEQSAPMAWAARISGAPRARACVACAASAVLTPRCTPYRWRGKWWISTNMPMST